MIISHKHKAIFLHARKTGGSSIKLNLYPHLGPDDIIVGGVTEIIEHGYKLNRSARRILTQAGPASIYALHRVRGRSHAQSANLAIKHHYRHIARLPEHATARELRAQFPKEFEEYFKFAFVRNPFTQVVSDYLWCKRNTGQDTSFAEYVNMLREGCSGSFVHAGGVRNFDIVSIDGKIACDFVGRVERMAEDFTHASSVLGIDCRLEKSAKVGDKAKALYGDLYSPRERDAVAELFADEIAAFGYKWPYESGGGS